MPLKASKDLNEGPLGKLEQSVEMVHTKRKQAQMSFKKLPFDSFYVQRQTY